MTGIQHSKTGIRFGAHNLFWRNPPLTFITITSLENTSSFDDRNKKLIGLLQHATKRGIMCT